LIPYDLNLMSRTSIDWESRIGRRLALRDLHVFFTVVRRASMAKAARELNVTQSAVSKIIADLEHTLGVRLLDRRPRGVEPTIYGEALLKRSTVVFDELKQSVRDIAFLANPTVGEVRIGCGEGNAIPLLPPAIQQFVRQYPGVALRVLHPGLSLDLPALRERILDFAVLRLHRTNCSGPFPDDLNVELLYNDQLVLAAGRDNPWARRRKIDLAELVNEPWILSDPDSWNYTEIEDAFRARGLALPRISVETFYAGLRSILLATGPYIASFPGSILRVNAGRYPLKVLPVDLPVRPWPVVMVTLKERTLSPLAERFMDELRKFAKTICADVTKDDGSPDRAKRNPGSALQRTRRS
jgi:DNA-binding transcriptional LysR family regulator